MELVYRKRTPFLISWDFMAEIAVQWSILFHCCCKNAPQGKALRRKGI